MVYGKKMYFWMFVIAVICSSCEKVIDVTLDDSTSQIVIEGEVTNVKGPYTVTVTESKNFEENNSFPGRDDAVVTIKDMTSGITETLKSKGAGAYQTAVLLGVAGRTYQLKVVLGDKTYTASSRIPTTAVKLDRIFAKRFTLDSKDIYIVPNFKDPVGKGNYYRLRQWVRGKLVKGSYVRDDEATDARNYDSSLFYDTDPKAGNPLINNGDAIMVELQCVDKGVHDFYRTLNTTIAQDAATPANPLSNISGGALGVFNACRSVKLTSTAKF